MILAPEGRLPLFGDSARESDLEPRRLTAAMRELLPFVPPAPESGDRVFKGAGLWRLDDPDEGHRLLLDAGEVCPDRLPAHGQADTFSFLLSVAGRAMVVDPGLHSYAAGEMRDYCRSTRAHSTVEVDGEDSSEVWSSFRVGRRARIRPLQASVGGRLATFSAEHDGYRHLGVRHARLVSHLAPGAWLVVDRLRARGFHDYRSRVHLHPSAVLERGEAGFTVHREGRTLTVLPFGAERSDTIEGWHCPEFGVRRASRMLEFGRGGGTVRFGYLLLSGEGRRGEVSADGDRVRASVDGKACVRAVP